MAPNARSRAARTDIVPFAGPTRPPRRARVAAPPPRQPLLVRRDGAERPLQSRADGHRPLRGIDPLAQLAQVVDDRRYPPGQLVADAPRLQLVWDGVAGDEDVVDVGQLPQDLAASPEQGHVRAEDLVEAEDVEVDVPHPHVDRPVRSEGDPVDADPRAAPVRQAGDLCPGAAWAQDVRHAREAEI